MEDARATAVLFLAEEVWGTTLNAIRSAASIGVAPLVAVAGEGARIFRSSSACRAAVDLPDDDLDGFMTMARDWAAARVGDHVQVAVVPLSDRLADHLNRSRQLFAEPFRVALCDAAVVDVLLDKRSSLRMAERAGLDVPPWTAVDGSPQTACDHLGEGPVVVKPARWLPRSAEYFKIELLPRASEVSARGLADMDLPMIVQEYLDAPDDAVEFAIAWRSRDSSRTSICTGRKRRQSHPHGGVMVWGEAVYLEDVAEAAERFLDSSGFTGLGGIEFIRTAEAIKFIEFNPRLEAIHFVAAAAGVDTVILELEDQLGLGQAPMAPRTVTQHQESAAAWISTAWIARVMSDPEYRAEAIRDWVAFRRFRRRRPSIWSSRDPKPGLLVASRLLLRAIRSMGGRTT